MSNILPNRDVLGTVTIGVIKGEVNDAWFLIFASAIDLQLRVTCFSCIAIGPLLIKSVSNKEMTRHAYRSYPACVIHQSPENYSASNPLKAIYV